MFADVSLLQILLSMLFCVMHIRNVRYESYDSA